MPSNSRRTISELFDDETAIPQALNAAAREAVLEHRQKGLPMAGWRDGKVVWIPADEIELGPESPSSERSE